MARPRRIDLLIVKRAQLTAATSTSVESLRQCQAVLLPALFGATLEQTAHVLGVGRATVPPPAGRLSEEPVGAAKPCPQRGRRPTVPAHTGGRRSVLKTVAGKRWQPC